MQRARFFGYRKGYLDLCRMYIPELLKDRFSEFAKSISHLDSQFHEAIIDQLTPSQYKYVVQESPNWRITSKSKSQDTVMRKLHFSNMLCQSIHFFKDKDKIVNIHLNKPDADLFDLDFTFENTENRIKICRYNYVRKLVIMPLNPNNEP